LRKTKSKWVVLFSLTAINLLNYLDRNIFSSLAPMIQSDLGLSDTQLGLLGSAFVFAYTLLAPPFGWWGDRGNRPNVMAFGAVVWSAATALSGYAHSFASQFATRVAVGFGEAAYSVIAPSFLADYFSRQARARVFAIYSGAIPIGSALGYVLGEQLGLHFGWAKAFLFVGIPGVIVALALMLLHEPRTATPAQAGAQSKKTWKDFFRSSFVVLRLGSFNTTVLGYSAYTFVVGGLSFWMPSYITRYFSVPNAVTLFGVITVVAGFVGTLLGGWWADWIEKRSGNGYLKVCVWSMLFAAPLFYVLLQISDFTTFMSVLFVLEVILFLCFSPLDAAVITAVPVWLRATAMALTIFLIHALGDGISRVLIGALSEREGLKSALALFPIVLGLAGLVWLWGLLRYWHVVSWPLNSKLKIPTIQAHRGLWKPTGLQENTLEAMQAAEAAEIEMVELDVRLSGDNEVVVFHDEHLHRLGQGSAKAVSDLSTQELSQMAKVSTLETILRSCSKLSFNIELKTNELLDHQLAKRVAEVVLRTGRQERVLFSSFNPFALRAISHWLPEVPRALLVTDVREPGNSFWLRKMLAASLARPHLLHLDAKMITRELMQDLRQRRVPVIAWTVNHSDKARELHAQGVLGFISDEAIELKMQLKHLPSQVLHFSHEDQSEV